MSEQIDLAEQVNLADPFPTRDHTYYGRGATQLGEDRHLIAAGHDRRSYAALNAMGRYDDGTKPLAGEGHRIRKKWATFEESCGCTEEQHARHNAEPPEGMSDEDAETAGYVDCYDHCDPHGLPPCDDQYGWIATLWDEPKVRGVPVLS